MTWNPQVIGNIFLELNFCVRPVDVFTGIKATDELLHARVIRKQAYINYITHHILQIPSISKPAVRRKRLLTLAPLKTKISQKEKEEKETNKLLRRRLAWCNQIGQQYDESEEQYSLLPREVDGSLRTGSKSKWTEKLQSLYTLYPIQHNFHYPYLKWQLLMPGLPLMSPLCGNTRISSTMQTSFFNNL